jgi:hypothetical protein
MITLLKYLWLRYKCLNGFKSKGEMSKHNWCLKRYNVQIIGKVNVGVVLSSFGFQEQIEGKWIKVNKECYSTLLIKLLLHGIHGHSKPNF